MTSLFAEPSGRYRFAGDFRAWEHSLRIHAECAIGGNELLTTRGYENPEVPGRGTLESPLAQELLDLRRPESQRLRMRERLKRESFMQRQSSVSQYAGSSSNSFDIAAATKGSVCRRLIG
jgi:hypothetical protein